MVLRGDTPSIVVRKHHIYDTESWDNYYVHLRVAEKPKQMVKQHYISTVSVIEKRCISMPI